MVNNDEDCKLDNDLTRTSVLTVQHSLRRSRKPTSVLYSSAHPLLGISSRRSLY